MNTEDRMPDLALEKGESGLLSGKAKIFKECTYIYIFEIICHSQ